jgi:hypothetical protein
MLFVLETINLYLRTSDVGHGRHGRWSRALTGAFVGSRNRVTPLHKNRTHVRYFERDRRGGY